MIQYNLVHTLLELTNQINLWDTPQAFQQLVEKKLTEWNEQYEAVVILGNVNKASIFIVQKKYVLWLSMNQRLENILTAYNLQECRYKKYNDNYANFERSQVLINRLRLPKVLLINVCNTSLRPIPRLNLSTASIASYLRFKGLAIVKIVDMQFGVSLSEILETVKQFDPAMVGISVDFMEYEVARNVIKTIQKANQNVKIVVGNVLPALQPDKFFEISQQIIISYGEGEESICDIVRWIRGDIELEKVSGITYQSENTIKKNEIRYVDLGDCQTPALDTALLLKKYRGVLTLETSRGCDYAACTFCPREHKTRFWRCFGVEQILEQIDDLLHVAHDLQLPQHIYFADEEMVGELKDGSEISRMISIFEKIIDKYGKIGLDIAVRADSIYNPQKDAQYNIQMIQMWRLAKKLVQIEYLWELNLVVKRS